MSSDRGRVSTSPWRRTAVLLPVLPFALFCLVLEIVPLVVLVRDSLRDGATGGLTLTNFLVAADPLYLRSLVNSLILSASTALTGGVLGALAAFIIVQRSERQQRGLVGFVAVASNFSGVPLAFAFILTIGTNGFVTQLLRAWFGIRLYPDRFDLYSWTGLGLVYLYFQIPLMTLLFTPALGRLRPVWREAVTMLGGSPWDYWRRVGLPVLAPPFASGVALLFANALGSYATAFALSGGTLSLFTIQIGFLVSGDIAYDPGSASALALFLAAIMGASIGIAQLSLRRLGSWLP